VSPFRGIAICEPRKYSHPGEPPLTPKAPAWQVALFDARPDRIGWELEKGGGLVEGEHFIGDRGVRLRYLNAANWNRPAAGPEAIRQQFADQVLLVTAGGVSQTVEGRRLVFRQPDEYRSAIGRHCVKIAEDISR
jgi:hypothetical protein